KSLTDGKRIKGFIRERNIEKVVIIGMGYIALEMSEALRSRNIVLIQEIHTGCELSGQSNQE
ncbi:MAG: hypothetical protein J7M20_09280, partial [Deltaproteobacteria bacterium]|nr:hypothetical protein [Deltaproteobacteria bacterium]